MSRAEMLVWCCVAVLLGTAISFLLTIFINLVVDVPGWFTTLLVGTGFLAAVIGTVVEITVVKNQKLWP